MFMGICPAQSMSICKCCSNILKLSPLRGRGQTVSSVWISKAPISATANMRLPFPPKNASTSLPTWLKEKCSGRLGIPMSLPSMPSKKMKENSLFDALASRQRGISGRTGEFLDGSPLPTYPRRSFSLSVFVVGVNIHVSCRMSSTLCNVFKPGVHSGLKSRILTSSETKVLKQSVLSPSKNVLHRSKSTLLSATNETRWRPTNTLFEMPFKDTAGYGYGILSRCIFLRSKIFKPAVVEPFMWSNMAMSYTKSNPRVLKVTVLGSAGSLGQPLSLMLKQSPLIDELALYDICNTKGMALDISHVDTKCRVCAFTGEGEIGEALENACIVLIVAGCKDQDKMNADDRFEKNAEIVRDLCETCAKYCPNALVGILTEPITSLVPVALESFRKAGKFNPKRVFGITALDGVRANTFTAELMGQPPENILVPVIGGCSGPTAVPVLSVARPRVEFSVSDIQRLARSVQDAGSEELRLKDGRGCPALSLAFAAARFAISLCKGVCGQPSVVECAYVHSELIEDCAYLATPVELGPGGVQRNLGLPKLSALESSMLKDAVNILKNDIKRGERFVRGTSAVTDKRDKEPPPVYRLKPGLVCICDPIPPPKSTKE